MRTFIVALLSACALNAAGLDQQPVTIPAYESIPRIGTYATPEEFKAALNDARFQLTRASYDSDGLTVFAYVYAPVKAASKLPVVVFNRGSYTWKEFAGESLTVFHRLASAGFLVVAPMYRGSGGAEGRDEMGGADLDDLLNITKVIRELPAADPDAVFMYGESRGAMMTYQAIREHFPMRAAATFGGFTDMIKLTEESKRTAQAANAIFPDWAQRKNEIAPRRSAIAWADKFETPVLIMHGGADDGVLPSHSIALAAKLQELGKPYQLFIRAGSDHHLSGWLAERDAAAVDWFRRHMPPPVRTVRGGNVLRSESAPPVTITIKPPFRYEGKFTFTLHGEFEGERYVFVDATAKKVTRMVVLQFERVKAESAETYNYNFAKAERIGKLDFIQNPFAFAPSHSIKASPAHEGEITDNFLLERGYELPNVWLTWRFVTLGNSDRKSEMIVFYMEGSDSLKMDDIYRGEESTPQWREMQTGLASRARAAFVIE